MAGALAVGATRCVPLRAAGGRRRRRVAIAIILAVVAAVVAPLAVVVLLVAVVVSAVAGVADTDSMSVAEGGTVSYTVDGSTFVDNDPTANWGGYANGQIPAVELCPVPTARWHHARCDAAAAFGDLTAAFKQRFGHDIAVTDAYRSFVEQVQLKASKGFLAATPGGRVRLCAMPSRAQASRQANDL